MSPYSTGRAPFSGPGIPAFPPPPPPFDPVIANHPGDLPGLPAGGLLGVPGLIAFGPRHPDLHSLGFEVRRPAGAGLRGLIGGLDIFARNNQLFEQAVHNVHDPVVAPEINDQLQCSLTEHVVQEHLIGPDVGAPELVDGLLGVTDDEELSRLQPDVPPARRLAFPLLRQEEDDFVLDRVGVLELIDQEVPDAVFQRAADLGAVPEQVPGPGELGIEVQVTGKDKVPPELSGEGEDQLQGIRDRVALQGPDVAGDLDHPEAGPIILLGHRLELARPRVDFLPNPRQPLLRDAFLKGLQKLDRIPD